MSKPSTIQPLGASSKICWSLYSDPGAGKTALIGSHTERVLIVAPPTDHRDSIVTMLGPRPNIEEWVVRQWDDLFEVPEYMRQEGYRLYDWLWLDSISLVQDTGLLDIWDTVIHEKPHRRRYGVDKQEYGINMFRLNEWVQQMVTMPGFNFGFTAHPFEAETLEGDLKLMPYIQGKNMAPKLCGYMNLVTYLQVEEGDNGDVKRRVLHSHGTDRFYAKDQFNAFGDKGRVVNPTMPKIMKMLEPVTPAATPKRRATRTRRRTKGS